MNIDTLKQRSITIAVPGKLYASLEKAAAEAKLFVTGYSTLLFHAAASERLKPGAAPDLTDAIGRVMLLWGTGRFDSAEIAAHVRLSEATVVRILDAWKAETAGKVAA